MAERVERGGKRGGDGWPEFRRIGRKEAQKGEEGKEGDESKVGEEILKREWARRAANFLEWGLGGVKKLRVFEG